MTLEETRGRRLQGFAIQFVTLTLLPLTALLVIISFGSITIHQNEMRMLVGQRDERAVQAAAVALSERLNHQATLLQALADRAAAEDGSPQTILSDSSYLLNSFDGGVAFYSPQGTWLAASTGQAVWLDRPVADLIRQTVEKTQPAFSTPFNDTDLGETVFAVAAPSHDQTVAAVGVVSPTALDLLDLTRELGSGPEAHTIVVSADGQLLFASSSKNDPVDLLAHPGVEPALRGESGSTYVNDLQRGTEIAVAYSPVTPVGWALVVEEPWSDVVNPLMQTSPVGPLVLIPALVLAGVALAFAVRGVIRPLQELERQAGKLASGDFTAIEQSVGGIGEIASLQQTLARMARQIRAYQDSIRRYLGALTQGQEDERRRLARELHDDTVQSLIALDQRVQLAQHAVKTGAPDTTERLAEVRRLTASLIEEVRRVIRALRPIYLEDLGLLTALEMLTQDVEKAIGIRGTFASEGAAVRLRPQHEIAVYRIVQEALNNVARHAEARAVRVEASFTAGALVVRVRDDGKGFTAPKQTSDLASSGHYGLLGMQERAELIGARLSIQSAPGAGALVELQLPL